MGLYLRRDIDVVQLVVSRPETSKAGRFFSRLGEAVEDFQNIVVGRVVVVDRVVDCLGQGVPVTLCPDGSTEEVDSLDSWTTRFRPQRLGGHDHRPCAEAVAHKHIGIGLGPG